MTFLRRTRLLLALLLATPILRARQVFPLLPGDTAIHATEKDVSNPTPSPIAPSSAPPGSPTPRAARATASAPPITHWPDLAATWLRTIHITAASVP